MSVPRKPGVPITNPSGYDDSIPLHIPSEDERLIARWKLACAAVRCGDEKDLRLALARLELL